MRPRLPFVQLVSASLTESAGAEQDRAPDLRVRTPLTREVAAEHLAAAWQTVVGAPITPQTLAVLCGHWALETGRGERMVGYNFGGLKGRGPDGSSHRLWTRESGPEGTERVLRHFRAYENAEEGALDYVRLLKDRYPRAARAAERGSVIDFADALAERGYFTDDPETYRRALVSLWREFWREEMASRSSAS